MSQFVDNCEESAFSLETLLRQTFYIDPLTGQVYLGVKSSGPDGAPSALGITITGSTTLTLDWTNGSTNEDGISIERSINGVDFAEIDTVAAGVSTYDDTGRTANTQYWYRVRAFIGTAYSSYSNTDNDTTWTTQYQAVYDAFTVTPSDADGSIQNDLVKDWIADGFWAEEDRIFNYAIHTGGVDTTRDWKDPTNAAKRCTLVNAPTHTAYQGYAFNGTNQYIDSNYNASTDGVNYLVNDCEYSYYARTQMGPANRMNIGADANPPFISIMRYWGDNNWYSAINGASQAFRAGSLAITDGLISVERDNATDYDDYRNGVKDLTTGTVSAGIPNLNIYIGADNFNTVASFFSNAQLSNACFGGALGTTIQSDRYDTWQAYLTNYGTQV